MKAVMKGLCPVVAFLTFAQAALAQDGVQLRYQMKKGEKFIYKKEQSVKQTQTVMNQKVETDMKQTDIGVWTVEEVDAKGNLQIKTENKQFNAKIKIGPLGEYTFDSKKKENDKGGQLGGSLGPIYERLSGAIITVTISPQGKVNEIKGYKELLGDVLKDNPFGEQFTGAGSDDAIKMSFSEYYPFFPDKAVSAGDKWETPFELKLPKLGKATGKNLYWYQGEGKVGNRKTHLITVASELSFELKIKMGGADITGNLSISNSKGTIHFDPKMGTVVSMNKEYTLSGNMNLSINGKDIPVTMEQVQQISLELLDSLPK